jgi:hypothetical protein
MKGFKLTVAVIVIALFIGISEVFEWMDNGHLLSAKDIGEMIAGGIVFAVVTILLSNSEDILTKVEDMENRLKAVEDRLRKLG